MSIHKSKKKPRSSDPALLERRKKYATAKWRKLRAEVLKGNPVCAICKIKPADTVDHIQHHRGDPNFYDRSNCRPACRACNSSMARTHGMGRGGVAHTPPWGGDVKSLDPLAHPRKPQNERFPNRGNDPLASILAKFINKAKQKESK